MFKIQKTTKGTINYLVNSENQFSRTNEEQSLGGSGLPSLTELARMKREIGHSRQEMASNFEQYMSRNTDHHKASFGGGLGQKFGFEYSAKNFELLKKGFWPGTKEDFERIYQKDRNTNSIANKNKELLEKFNLHTTIIKPTKKQAENERTNKKSKYDVGLKLKETNGKLSLITQRPPKEVNGKTKGQTQEGESIVFACPKGLSMFYAVADKTTQNIINRVIDKAVEETMKEYALKLLPSTKEYQDKIDPTKTALLYASFDHIENRNVEPHKHKHVEVSNFAEFTFKDGTKKILAPDTANIYKDTKELTSMFNTMLVAQLEKAQIKTKPYEEQSLGFSFQIVGIDREKEEKLITRKEEMKKNIYEKNKDKHKDIFYTEMELEESRRDTQKQKSTLHNSDSLHSVIRTTTEKVVSFEEIVKAQNEYKREKQIFDYEKIINMSKIELAGEAKKSEVIAEIYNQLKYVEKFDNAESLRNRGNEIFQDLIDKKLLVTKDNGQITSRQIIENEVHMLENFQELKQKNILSNKPINKLEVREFNDRQKFKMNKDQMKACEELTKDSYITCCIGSAGVGKTYSYTKFANEFHTARDRKVIGLATQTTTAKALADAGIKETFNIDSFLMQVNNEKIDLKNTTLIIDEAGMVGTKHYRQLSDLVLMHDCRLVLVGDSKQLASVSAGNGFTQILNTVQDYSLIDKNMRQQNETTFDIAEAFKRKDIDKAISILSSNNLLHQAQSTQEVNKKLVEDYMKDPSKEKMIIASTNEEVNQLNDMVREQLKELRALEGKNYKEQTVLIKQGDSTALRQFSKDDEIVFTKNMKIAKDSQLLNGDRGKIVATRESVFTIELERKDQNNMPIQVKIDTKEHNNFNHSYAITTHKSQGKTVDSCYIKGGDLTSSNSAYVNFSRQKEKVSLYIETDKLKDFIAKSKIEQVKASTTDDKNCQVIAKEILEQRRLEKAAIEKTNSIKYQKPDIRQMQIKAQEKKKELEKQLKEQQEKELKKNLENVEQTKQRTKSIQQELEQLGKPKESSLDFARRLSAECKEHTSAKERETLKQIGPRMKI